MKLKRVHYLGLLLMVIVAVGVNVNNRLNGPSDEVKQLRAVLAATDLPDAQETIESSLGNTEDHSIISYYANEDDLHEVTEAFDAKHWDRHTSEYYGGDEKNWSYINRDDGICATAYAYYSKRQGDRSFSLELQKCDPSYRPGALIPLGTRDTENYAEPIINSEDAVETQPIIDIPQTDSNIPIEGGTEDNIQSIPLDGQL